MPLPWLQSGFPSCPCPPVALLVGQGINQSNLMNSTPNTITDIPGSASFGAVSGHQELCAQQVVVSGPGEYYIAHGQPYVPNMCWVVPVYADAITPTNLVAFVKADATNVWFSVSGAGTYNVYYV